MRLEGDLIQEHPADGYGRNDGCVVTAEDAAALADALEVALPDIPRHAIIERCCGMLRAGVGPLDPTEAIVFSEKALRERFITEVRYTDGTKQQFPWSFEDPFTPLEWFAGDVGRGVVQRLIEFCQHGPFAIY